MSDSQTSAADASGDARAEGFSSVSDAVAEMDRREQERAAAKAAKAKKAAAASNDDDDTDDGEADGRRPAKRVDGIDDDDEAPAKAKKAKPDDDEGDDDQADDDAKNKDDDDDADEDEGDDEDDDQQDDDEDDDKPEDKKAKPVRFKVRVDDREVETTPEEVAEYIKASSAERQLATQARQVAAQQMQQIQQHAATLSQIAQYMLGSEPDLQLAQTDPGTYIAQQAQHRQRLAVLQQIQQLGAQAQARQAEQQQQAFHEFAAGERQALLRAMPELADPDKLSAFKGRAVKVAQKYGIRPEELGNQFDHRSFLMLRDLSRLHDMDAERAKTRKQLKAAPQLKAPEPGAAIGQRQGTKTKDREAKRAFMKSPKTMRDVRAYLARTER